jgi:Ca-activated chloride channel family protein
MNDNELKNLKDFPTPAPRPGARAKAFAAAMAAFDQASQKNAEAPQGNAGPIRLIHASSEQKRSRPMRAWPVSSRVAASVAAMLLAAPLAFYVVQRQGGESEPPAYKAARSEPSAPVVSAAPVAPEPQPADAKKEDLAAAPKVISDRFAHEAPAGVPGGEAVASSNALLGWRSDNAIPEFPQSARLSKEEYDKVRPFNFGAASKFDDEVSAPASPPAPARSKAAGSNTRIVAGAPAPASAQEPLRKQEVVRLSAAQPGETESRAAPVAAPASPPPPPRELTVSADQPVQLEEQKENRDKFNSAAPGPIKQTAVEPVSTFSIDVDTASYGFARRALNAGHLPPKDSVRVEEMINYFPYNYPRPDGTEKPFQPTVTVTPAPWNPTNKLVHIAIKGYDLKGEQRPRANVVLLIDVSGSMSPENRLPLVKNAFRLLVNELKSDDTVGIVTYASGSGVALEPTKVSEKSKILSAIDRLGAGGSTAGAQGIQDAYRLAEAHFDKTGVNRIILATDGDFNVGVTSQDELKRYIEQKRQTGIFLSILGVGQDNYNDALMQTLAQNGNGVASYVDTLNEARKVLVDEASSTLFTIAKDVKIQMEFNPAQISEYRLIGYETRALKREDFNNDKVDAGEIGSGHTVTAIYEVTPVGAPKFVDDLRYQKPEAKAGGAGAAPDANELGFLKLRYKLPKEDVSKLITIPVTRDMEKSSVAEAPEDVRFSIAVAGFGQLLRDLPYLKSFGYDDVIALGQGARGADPFGYRSEFLNMVRLAKLARQ